MSLLNMCRCGVVAALAGTLLASLAVVPAGAAPAPAATPAASARVDYLDTALRQRVQALKRDVQSTPTNASNLAQRAVSLADWVDAYSLAGGHVSLDVTGVRGFSSLPVSGAPLSAATANLDRWVREFTMRDEQPDAIGTLSTAALGPFEATTLQTVAQTYTVGSKPIATGGGFWIARQFQTGYGDFQVTDPAGAGYVSIVSSNPGVQFKPDQIMAGGPHGGFRGLVPALAFRLSAGELKQGDTVTVTYGDRAAGGPGLSMPDFTTERMPLPIYVDFDGSSEWISLPMLEFVVVGTKVAGVHGFAPSVVKPGEGFELAVRAEDYFFNRATGPIPAFEVLVDGVVRHTTPAGSEAITLLRMQIDEPGAHWITLRSADGTLQGEANPVLVSNDATHGIYWGDTHGHSGYAEGVGTMDYYMRFARDEARLDYVTHSEHDTALDDWEWEEMRRMTQKYQEDGRFVAFLGYEWTVSAPRGGHHNVLYRTPEGRERTSALEFPTLSRFYKGLRDHNDAKDVLVIPHAHNPGDYRHSDPNVESLIEVMSMHGTFEWFAHMYLSHGHEVGFIAASDDHLSHPGYSAPKNTSLSQRGGLGAVLATARTRDAIFDAMKARRTYATTGDRIILDVSLNGTGMGQRAPSAPVRKLNGRVIGTGPIASIAIVKNERDVWQKDYVTDTTASAAGGDEYLLSFFSEAFPFHPSDMPRGWRHWRGKFTVDGATVVNVQAMDFINRATQSLAVNGNTVTFKTNTRGDTSSLRMKLADVRPGAKIVIELEAAEETGGAPPMYRQPANIAGKTVTLALADLKRGELSAPMAFDGFKDNVQLRRIIKDGQRDVSFEFTDQTDPREGDHYYVRVKQVNDAMAWSSPIWVGGYPHR